MAKNYKLSSNKVAGTRVVSASTKIVLVFTVFLLSTNLATNYVNLIINQSVQIDLINDLLVRDLKDIYTFSDTQHQMFLFDSDETKALSNIRSSAKKTFARKGGIAFGLKKDGSVLFLVSESEGNISPEKAAPILKLQKSKLLDIMESNLAQGTKEGILQFDFFGDEYFSAYRYNKNWDCYILRGERYKELYRESRITFALMAASILIITFICVFIGNFIIKHILRFIRIITKQIMVMEEQSTMELIDLEGAVNDDISYMGIAFNSLSSTISNLVQIFQKFVAKDVAIKAYEEGEIRLEGSQKELTILFTDIKGFTYMTETLGTSIIKLLNLHYDKAIRAIIERKGDIGSIIGDALLAIYGIEKSPEGNKSYMAIQSGYQIVTIAAHLREEMHKYEAEILRTKGFLSDLEKHVLRAVLIDVGVGIDGGTVFYGNIGSFDRMVNTVIGDNVNSSSRLEGLTRFYKIPIIVSEYIKNEVENNYPDFRFVELDMVQVKGKTIGKKIFWPVKNENLDSAFKDNLDNYEEGLKHYYKGDWTTASKLLEKSDIPPAAVILERILRKSPPEGWNGIWTMKEK